MSVPHRGKGPISKMMAKVIVKAMQDGGGVLDMREVHSGQRQFLMSLAHRGLISGQRDKKGAPAWSLTPTGIEAAKMLVKDGYWKAIAGGLTKEELPDHLTGHGAPT